MFSLFPFRKTILGIFLLVMLALALPLVVQRVARAQTDESPAANSPDAAARVCSLTVNVAGEGAVTQARTNFDPALRVEVDPAREFVILENSVLYVRYERYIDLFDNSEQFNIRQFRLKQYGNADQAGPGYLDAAYHRGALTNAEVIYDGLDRKTVRLHWVSKPNNPNLPAFQPFVSEISIYPNSQFLKIDYVNAAWAVVIVDLGRPGGTTTGENVAYGAAGWSRGYVAHPESFFSVLADETYNDPPDGGSLNYKNNFIVGVYNPANNQGLGRTLPIQKTDGSGNITRAIKFLYNAGARHGFEITTPAPANAVSFTSFLYAVTGGPEEIIATGMTLLDDTTGDYGDQCGEVVELTAVPAPGWYFRSWSGDITGADDTASITLTADHVITATFGFELYDLNLTVTPADGSGGGVDVQPQKARYRHGDRVTLTPRPQPGWTFAGWQGDLTGDELAPQELVMTADRTVAATFTQNQYALTIDVVGNGTVTRQPAKAFYVYGDIVILTAVAEPGWRFAGWSDGLDGNPTPVLIQEDRRVTATFTQNQYLIDVTVQGSGRVTRAPDKPTYVYGEQVTLTAIPDPGVYFTGWHGDLGGRTNPYTLTVRDDLRITVSFDDAPPPTYLPVILYRP
jgi:uncharacterized repeat protein (TIGR02543 family)